MTNSGPIIFGVKDNTGTTIFDSSAILFEIATVLVFVLWFKIATEEGGGGGVLFALVCCNLFWSCRWLLDISFNVLK